MTKGERIKEAREKKGYSQVYVADKIGVIKQTYYKYEHNLITNIPSDIIVKLADTLGVSEAYIMGWPDRQATVKRLEKYWEMLNELTDEHRDKVLNDIKYWHEKERE